jgi:hypothetical protein
MKPIGFVAICDLFVQLLQSFENPDRHLVIRVKVLLAHKTSIHPKTSVNLVSVNKKRAFVKFLFLFGAIFPATHWP